MRHSAVLSFAGIAVDAAISVFVPLGQRKRNHIRPGRHSHVLLAIHHISHGRRVPKLVRMEVRKNDNKGQRQHRRRPGFLLRRIRRD